MLNIAKKYVTGKTCTKSVTCLKYLFSEYIVLLHNCCGAVVQQFLLKWELIFNLKEYISIF